jgi:hypothetical protein
VHPERRDSEEANVLHDHPFLVVVADRVDRQQEHGGAESPERRALTAADVGNSERGSRIAVPAAVLRLDPCT